MAFQSQRTITFLTRLNISRYIFQYIPSSTSLFRFSTIDSPLNYANGEQSYNEINIDECQILNELSILLPIRHKTSIQTICTENSQLNTRAVDDFLSAEEKLRGIFLQKLKGKTAIERALTNVGVELSSDVVAKVVNRGSLGGQAMILFFNWAIVQPEIDKGIDTYHIILKALGRRKFFVYMVEMLHEMRTGGIIPNHETLFIVMDSFVRGHQVSKAIQMFGHLEDYGFKCDTESLNAILQCLCQRSHVSTANSLLNKMREKVVFSGLTYNIVLKGWSKIGRVSEIEKTLKAMVADGFDPDSSTHSYLLECLGRAGMIDDAVEIFENLYKKGCVADAGVYNAMISNFISNGDCDECLKYYERMLSENCDPNMDTYIRIIYGFLKARKVSDSIEMFDEMLGRGIIPSTGTITSFIELLCSYGPPHAALMVYKKARKAGCRISLSAYKLLLMRLSRLGKCGMLLNIWDEMQKSGYSSDVEVYQHVIIGLCNIGQLENAVLVMEESLCKGFCPSRIVCSKLSNKLLSSNKVEMAYKLFLKIKDARHNENAKKFWRAKGWHF